MVLEKIVACLTHGAEDLKDEVLLHLKDLLDTFLGQGFAHGLRKFSYKKELEEINL